jgi:hypothetical protein
MVEIRSYLPGVFGPRRYPIVTKGIKIGLVLTGIF